MTDIESLIRVSIGRAGWVVRTVFGAEEPTNTGVEATCGSARGGLGRGFAVLFWFLRVVSGRIFEVYPACTRFVAACLKRALVLRGFRLVDAPCLGRGRAGCCPPCLRSKRGNTQNMDCFVCVRGWQAYLVFRVTLSCWFVFRGCRKGCRRALTYTTFSVVVVLGLLLRVACTFLRAGANIFDEKARLLFF